jgi:predicted ribosome quality control (RQC) complex YloA/Tae2 family protein
MYAAVKMAQPSDEIARLYGLAIEEFTAARDRLAIELRERGDREAAGKVKGLRKPSVSAWTVNQLVRKQSKKVQELLAVGDQVRSALSGTKGADVRQITDRRRKALDGLLDLAEDLLNEAGHSASRPTLDKVGDTLMAATMSQEAADAVRSGNLERELAPQSGFEVLSGVDQIPVAAKATAKRDQRDRERAKRAVNQAREAEERARAADREARRLEQEAERLQRDAERARRRADRAAEQANEMKQKAAGTKPGRKA